ncbi:Guanine nucleotide-binding protein alpha-4 subunit [Grifola frondosa]|uniref:Guanine nucleotide-binding protein alpha-4 subunit n=1 Tax=Grifola frondosa TaxID=5627 RepID=A0A1C7M3Q7_GRIFR|nr:Guanine nucleotide-binding protein alpha-4 subunit [Grifola frondosa]
MRQSRLIDDAEALRISNAIDEDLKICGSRKSSYHSMPPAFTLNSAYHANPGCCTYIAHPLEHDVYRLIIRCGILAGFLWHIRICCAGQFAVSHPTYNASATVMLLGQAESGKSTLQKQFQLYYSSQTLDHERPSWRPIVYFNILKAIRMILDELDYEYNLRPSDPLSVSVAASTSTSGSGSSSSSHSRPDPSWFPELAQIRTKLLPLVASEDALASELSGGITVSGGRTGVFVRAGWQALVTSGRSYALAESHLASSSSTRQSAVANIVAKTIAASSQEIEQLWHHPGVQSLLRNNKLRLEEYAAFFLASIRRIAQPDYLPSTEDILHVRLQTIGVTEHTFDINMGGTHYNWLLYDVGGARHAWVPYFDDGMLRSAVVPASRPLLLCVPSAFRSAARDETRFSRVICLAALATAIIFLAPISAFDSVGLTEAEAAGRDQSSQIVRAAGAMLAGISSYGDRPNSYEEVSEYFRAHFIQVHKRKDVSHRPLYLHFTSMLDIKATQAIIINVGEAIMRLHLSKVGLA